MATVFRLRYIYAGSRLIFVEQPDSDKYRIVHSDLVLGQSLVGFISPDSRFSGSQTGIKLGSATETQTYEDPRFAEMQGKILLPHTAIGYAHISRFVSVSGGLTLDHAADPLSTETKLGEVKDKLTTPSTAEVIKTGTQLTGAKERILTGQQNKTFKTPAAKIGHSSTGAAFGHGAAGIKVDDILFGGAASGSGIGQTVQGTVTSQYTIHAGTYASQVSFTTLDDLFRLMVNGYVVYGEESFPFFGLDIVLDSGGGGATLYTLEDDPDDPASYKLGETAESSPGVYCWDIMFSDDGTFTLTEDVTLTAERFAIFNRYFKLVTP